MLKVVSSEQDAPKSDSVEIPSWQLAIDELSDREHDLIKDLREEANAATETFTKYVFQTLSISGVALGAIIEFMFFLPIAGTGNTVQSHPLLPLVGLAAFPILIFSLAVCRIGTYYYTDANRRLGFELFLSRVRLAPTELSGRWRNEFKRIDWEEAMRAWRVVQETLFHRIHPRERLLLRHKYADGFAPDPKSNPVWYCQTSLFGEGSKAVWKTGKYLDTMQLLLLFVAFVASLILWLVPLMTTVPLDRASFTTTYTITTTATVMPKDGAKALKASLPDVAKDLDKDLTDSHLAADKRATRTVTETRPNSEEGSDHTLIFYIIDQKEWGPNLNEYSFLTILTIMLLVLAIIAVDYRRDRSRISLWSVFAALAVAGLMFWIVMTGHRVLHPDKLFLWGQWDNRHFAGSFLSVATTLTAALSTAVTWLSVRNERARRQMLKDGILSLHSCAIVWEAVVIAHFSAIERARRCKVTSWRLAKLASPSFRKRYFGKVPAKMWADWQAGTIGFEKIVAILQPETDTSAKDGAGMPGYTFWLGQEAVSLARCARFVPSWVGLGEEGLTRLEGSSAAV